jgi:hypothetical protein
MDARLLQGIPYCNRVLPLSRPVRTALFFHKSLQGTPGLTCTPLLFQMSIRIYLVKAVMLAKGFMTLRLSSEVWQVRCGRIPCSATICSKGSMDARAGHGYHPYTKNIRHAIWCTPAACAAGFAATGSCCPGCSPIVRTESGMAQPPIPIDLWKVFDNLRRSLLPPTLLALFAAGWLFLPGSPLSGRCWCYCLPACPLLCRPFSMVRHHFGRLPLKQILQPTLLPLTRWALAIIFLPYEALLMLGAIAQL